MLQPNIEQRRMEEALRESEARFRALLDQANDAIFLLLDGYFVDCNARGQEMYGRTREQILGRMPDAFAPPTQPDGRDTQEKGMEIFHRVLTGEPQFFEWLSCLPDGTPLYTEVSLNRLELAGKIYIQAIVRDITERKRAEEQIAEQAAFLDEARDAIIVRDITGNIRFWNKGAERVYGWTRQEVVGRNVLEVLQTPRKKFEELNRLTITQGEWHGELHHHTKDRRKLVVAICCSLIRDSAGRPKSILSINTDITERKKIEAQFMRAQRMESVGTLAGGIAHDLNNILAPIVMSIEVLKQRATDSHSKHILETIAGNAKRGADIVRQLLSFARGVEGERLEVDPRDLIKNTETIIKDIFPRNIRLEVALPEKSWSVLGDLTQLHQVLLNLCLNARDAMPDGGKLTIAVETLLLDNQFVESHPEAQTGRYVVIDVGDSGSGIPATVIDKIFEPFFTTKELGKGTGLGLSMVQAIVKSHGGFVTVTSKPDQGTNFKVYFPAMDVSLEAQKDPSATTSLPIGNGEVVLVVDDEPSVLVVTSETLTTFGYRTLTANDGSEAVKLYQQHRDEIAAVLTDMAMPVMDGMATIRALREINPEVKIIVASGSTSGKGITIEPDIQVQQFLAKPYTAATLLRTLRTVLGKDRARP